jgi:hypothetical protein
VGINDVKEIPKLLSLFAPHINMGVRRFLKTKQYETIKTLTI